MATNLLHLETYRIVNDPTMDENAKRAAIDALWGPPAIAAPTGPDMRVAQNDSTAAPFGSNAAVDPSWTPPTPAPAAADVPAGGMSVAPAPNMSTISPDELATAAAAKASTPAPAAPGPPPPPTADERFNAAMGELARGALRGSPGVRVEAHDQPVSSVVEKTAPIDQEKLDRLEKSQLDEKLGAIVQGDTEAAAAEEAKQQASRDVIKANADLADQQLKQKFAEDHVRELDQKYQQLVKDTQANPGDFWSSRDTGHKVLAAIAAVMFGLGGDSNGVARMVEHDVARRQLNRDKNLSAFRTTVEDAKAMMLSPEAAHQAEMSLGLRAAAAEARRLAASAAAPEARANALAKADELEKHAALLAVNMAHNEAGTIKQQIAHLPAKVVGGKAGGLSGLKELKAAGLNPESAIRAAVGGNYGSPALSSEQLAQRKDEVGRRVDFPDTGETLYAKTPEEAVKLQEAVRGVSEIRNAYQMLKGELAQAGHSISPKTLARVNAIIANNTINLKTAAELGVLSKSDLDLIAPLTGKDVNGTLTLDSSTTSGMDTAASMLGTKLNVMKKTLYKSPGGETGTGGSVASEVEVPK